MIITDLTIQNFRSYYGIKHFKFGKRLNLILGSNGDGKSTLFDALNWVLTYKNTDDDPLPEDKTLVSQKLFQQMTPNSAPQPVRVTVVARNANGNRRCLVKEFYVQKREDGSIQISGTDHKGFLGPNNRSKQAFRVSDILEKERLFPAKIKKYSILAGEERLNIFEDSKVLAELIDMYSEVKDLMPYKEFAQYIEEKANQAKINSRDKALTSTTAARKMQEEIEGMKVRLGKLNSELEHQSIVYKTNKKKIKEISDDMDIISDVHELNAEIKNIQGQINNKREQLNEDYAVRLLDELWILGRMKPIIDAFNQKMASFEEQERQIRNAHNEKIAEVYARRRILKETKDKLKKSIDAIPGFMPEMEALESMIQNHRCKYCNTEAPEGSAALAFMKQKLAEMKAKLQECMDDESDQIADVEPLNMGDNVKQIAEKGRAMERSWTGADFKEAFVQSYRRNLRIEQTIKKGQERIDEYNEKIIQRLANSKTGKNLMTYVDDWKTTSKLNADYGRAEASIEELNRRIPELEKKIQDREAEYDKKVNRASRSNNSLAVYRLTHLFNLSLNELEDETYTKFLDDIAMRANAYMEKITVDDFIGTIKMEVNDSMAEKGAVDIQLVDNRGIEVVSPNKSLQTTKCISVLLALADYHDQQSQGDGYPLILDAPTSSFDAGKDETFYKSLSELQTQCIIVTKSFLYKDEASQQFVVDSAKLASIDCPVYRIKKNEEGYDQKNLSTIETMVEEIKGIPE